MYILYTYVPNSKGLLGLYLRPTLLDIGRLQQEVSLAEANHRVAASEGAYFGAQKTRIL